MNDRNMEGYYDRVHRYESYFRRIFGETAVGVARVAPDGRFLMVSPALCRALRYSKGELLTKTCEAITHPDDRPGEAAIINNMLTSHARSYKMEKRYVRRSGVPLWVTETGSAITDGSGSLLYRVCVIQVNERSIAEAHFQSAIEAAASGMVMTNREGTMVLVNSNTEQLFGYSRNELLGRPISMLLADSLAKTHQRLVAELTGRRKNRSIGTKWDIYGRRRDGELFPVELGLNPVDTLKGTWILSSIVDMSKRMWPDKNLRETTVLRIDTTPRETGNNRPSVPISASRVGC